MGWEGGSAVGAVIGGLDRDWFPAVVHAESNPAAATQQAKLIVFIFHSIAPGVCKWSGKKITWRRSEIAAMGL